VTAVSSGAEADRHLLHDASHYEREDDEGEEEAHTETRAGRGIGEHAGAVVFAEHDEDTGADEEPEQARPGPEAAPSPRLPDTLAVVGAVDVFVGDFNIGSGFGPADEKGRTALDIRAGI
jgi:hypothetical protein